MEFCGQLKVTSLQVPIVLFQNRLYVSEKGLVSSHKEQGL